MTLESSHEKAVEDRLILHDLKGVNLKVDFFLGTREELLHDTKCISYSICWKTVDVRIEQITVSELISDLDFFYCAQQLYIDDQAVSGDVISFRTEPGADGLIAFCTIALGRDY